MNKKVYVLFIIIFAIAFESITYMLAKLTPIEATLLTSSIDNLLPFVEYFVYPYFLWYICLIVIPFIIYITESNEFFKYISSCILASLIAFFIFLFFPTIIERPAIEANSISTWLVNVVYAADTPALDCFPSMHCALATLFILCSVQCKNLPKWSKFIIYIVSVLIMLSTIYIKQHVIYDVLGGMILAFISYLLTDKFQLHEKLEVLSNKIYLKICKK